MDMSAPQLPCHIFFRKLPPQEFVHVMLLQETCNMMQKDAAKQANRSVGSDFVPLHCLGLFGGAPPLQTCRQSKFWPCMRSAPVSGKEPAQMKGIAWEIPKGREGKLNLVPVIHRCREDFFCKLPVSQAWKEERTEGRIWWSRCGCFRPCWGVARFQGQFVCCW